MMLCNTTFGIYLRGGFVRARCGPLRNSKVLKGSLYANIEKHKEFFLFYRNTYSTVGYPKYQYITLHSLYEPLRGAFGILDNICLSV